MGSKGWLLDGLQTTAFPARRALGTALLNELRTRGRRGVEAYDAHWRIAHVKEAPISWTRRLYHERGEGPGERVLEARLTLRWDLQSVDLPRNGGAASEVVDRRIEVALGLPLSRSLPSMQSGNHKISP